MNQKVIYFLDRALYPSEVEKNWEEDQVPYQGVQIAEVRLQHMLGKTKLT